MASFFGTRESFAPTTDNVDFETKDGVHDGALNDVDFETTDFSVATSEGFEEDSGEPRDAGERGDAGDNLFVPDGSGEVRGGMHEDDNDDANGEDVDLMVSGKAVVLGQPFNPPVDPSVDSKPVDEEEPDEEQTDDEDDGDAEGGHEAEDVVVYLESRVRFLGTEMEHLRERLERVERIYNVMGDGSFEVVGRVAPTVPLHDGLVTPKMTTLGDLQPREVKTPRVKPTNEIFSFM